MYKIVLASGSPRRKEIFEQVEVNFTVCASDLEEVITKVSPEEIVIELATMKAKDVAKHMEGNTIVIGADTMVAIDGRVLGKPRDEEDATNMLRNLQGNKHQVYTGVSVVIKQSDNILNNYKAIHFVEKTDVWVNPMTEGQIAAYVGTSEPYDKAGAYGIQGKFAINIGKIEGDYYNIVGFPISKLYTILLNEGIDLLNL